MNPESKEATLNVFSRIVLLAAFALMLPLGVASAQFEGVTQEVSARGTMDYAEVAGGPADVYVGTIKMEPSSSYGGWHSHPGPVWVVVTAGELALYGPDGCRWLYAAGSAYLAEPDALYDLRNESVEALDVTFVGVIRAGQPATVPASAAPAGCGE